MERTQIYLTAEEAQALDREAGLRGVTRSQLIREAIDARYITAGESRLRRLLAVIEELDGPWSGREDIPDGAAYVERIRAGMDNPVDGEAARAGSVTDAAGGPGSS